MDFEKLQKSFEKKGYIVSHFQTAAAAARHIADELAGKTVGMGGSMSVDEAGLYDALKDRCTVHWHLLEKTDDVMLAACSAPVYITSANAVSEDGCIVNIDGRGNRLAGTLMKKERVIFLVGANKVAPDLASAIERARSIAAPRNASRLGCKTPCAVTGHCHDCASPERICSALLVFWQKPFWAEEMELVFVDESLGY